MQTDLNNLRSELLACAAAALDHFAGTDDQQFGTILAQLAELTITQSEIIEDMEAAIVSLTAHLTALVDAS